MLGACARPVGDLGRYEKQPWNDLPPVTGTPAAKFNLTDQEREMRDRISRYLEAPQPYDLIDEVKTAMKRLDRSTKADDRTDRYYLWLHKQTYVSSRARFGRLGADIEADIETMPVTFASICAVQEIDRRRGVAFNSVVGLGDDVGQEAAARRAENDALIESFAEALSDRYDSYSYALDHLLVETPHEDAVAANEALTRLAMLADAADRRDFCDRLLAVSRIPEPSIRSRYDVESAATVAQNPMGS